jgi:dCTP deaminase
MPFWTTQKIRQALQSKSPPIINPKLDRVNTACYEMALGSETFVTSTGEVKQRLNPGDQVQIPPGQFGLLITEEEVSLPCNLLAFISIKASKKMSGLVNVSGFHVDPGFSGRLKYSVYNAGSESIILEVGERLFPIWFYELPEANDDEYEGRHKGQMSISSDDVMRLQGDVASPAALKKEIDELHSAINNWKYVTMSVLGSAVTLGIGAALWAIFKAKSP